MAVLATAASAFGRELIASADLAQSLELFGVGAQYLMAMGLFAAGISSATAPLASAYALSGIMGWSGHLKAARSAPPGYYLTDRDCYQ